MGSATPLHCASWSLSAIAEFLVEAAEVCRMQFYEHFSMDLRFYLKTFFYMWYILFVLHAV